MIGPRIIVTGATGKTGSVVTAELLKAGYPIRVLAHREDGRSTLLKAQEAEIAVADLSDVEPVTDAKHRQRRRCRGAEAGQPGRSSSHGRDPSLDF